MKSSGVMAMRSGFEFRMGRGLHRAAGLLMVGLVVSLGGCGKSAPKPVPVKGSVIFRGKPLAKARVTFFQKGAPLPATGDTNDNGEFTLTMYKDGDGALVGENKVTIVMLPSSSPDMMGPPDPAAIASGKASAPLTAKVQRPAANNTFPGVYGDSQNTPLTWTVKAPGETDAKFDLK